MLGILVILAASWLLLHFVEKKNLFVLGVTPTSSTTKFFLFGLVISSLLCAIAQLGDSMLNQFNWSLNQQVSLAKILKAGWWDLKSVVTEELVFRGAILLILMNRIGERKGILISAVAFGIYHWFSYGIIGNIIPMIFIFIGTGLMGYAFAYSFAKGKSILFPIGLHLGWNFTQNTIFSKGPLGEILFLSTGNGVDSEINNLTIYFISMILTPLVIIFVVRFITGKS